MKFLIGLIICAALMTVMAKADNIPAPPPLATLPAELQHYLRSIYENLHRLPVVTTTPNGSRRGKKGDMVFLITGGRYYLEVNSDSSNSWSGVELLIRP